MAARTHRLLQDPAAIDRPARDRQEARQLRPGVLGDARQVQAARDGLLPLAETLEEVSLRRRRAQIAARRALGTS